MPALRRYDMDKAMALTGATFSRRQNEKTKTMTSGSISGCAHLAARAGLELSAQSMETALLQDAPGVLPEYRSNRDI